MADNKIKIIIIALVMIVIIGLAASAIFISQSNDKNKPVKPKNSFPNITEPSRPAVDINGAPFIGEDNSPVVMVEFTDFQCAYCALFHTQTFPQIKEKYIDTGKVRYVVKDFPLAAHKYSEQSAVAAECSYEQGGVDTYFKYIDILYNNQDFLNKPMLKEYAARINLSQAEFNNCLENKTSFARVERDGLEGERLGVTGTPYFFINGVAIDGAYPFEVFDSVISQELAATSRN